MRKNQIEILPAYRHQEDLLTLFQEYTNMMMRLGGEDVRACLEIQRYDNELTDLSARYAPPKGRLYLAMVDGTPAGCAALKYNDDTYCELKRLFVRPLYRGLHIGGMLARKVIADAKEIGYRYVRLDTFPFMMAAIRMYERYGFRLVDRYNDNPAMTALFMQLDLSTYNETERTTSQ